MDAHQPPLSDQRNYMFSPYNHYPSNPHQMKMESPRIPMHVEPSFYSGNYCYPSPGCHGCCNYDYHSPGYYAFRPPFPHISSPPMYHYGSHCSYPESYPAYFAPPHYSPEVPRYEYDKKTVRGHCCGCPNHTCNHQKVDNTMKIEEPPEVKLHEGEAQKPGVELKDSEHTSTKLQNYPYPIVWMPPDYRKDKETQKSSIAKPQTGNEWSPVDMNDRYLKQGGEEKRDQHLQNEQNVNSFPFPLIWMPGYGMPQDVRKESSVTPRATEEPQRNIKIIPLKFHESDDHRDKPRHNREEDTGQGQSEMPNEEIKPKDVFVKNAKGESNSHTGVAEKGIKTKNIPVKQLDDNEVKSLEAEVKKQPTSPGKVSKLPPICLRVDPLPKKKKSGSGSSRSPSPPASRDKAEQAMSTESSEDKHKVHAEQNETTLVEAHSKKHHQDKRQSEEAQKKIIEVMNLFPSTDDGRKQIPATDFGTSTLNGAEDDKRSGEMKQNKLIEKDMKKDKVLSGTDAATRIQSAYRGYEARKWEPLKKLRQIMRVRLQMEDIRNRIKELETSTWSEHDQKEKIVISEMIMSLLLQLDTIQGLHPSVREVRKVVARELTCLQEKLDSLSALAAASKTRISVSIPDEKPANEHGLDTNESTLHTSPLEEEMRSDSEEPTLFTSPLEGEIASDSSLIPDINMEKPLLDDRLHLEKSQEDIAEIPVVNNREILSEAMEPELPVCENIMSLPSRIDESSQSEEKSVQSQLTKESSEQSPGVDTTHVAPLVSVSKEESGDLGQNDHQEETPTREGIRNDDHLIDNLGRQVSKQEHDVEMPDEEEALLVKTAEKESEGIAISKSHPDVDDIGSGEYKDTSSTSQIATEESDPQILFNSMVDVKSDCVKLPAIGESDSGVVEKAEMVEAGGKQDTDLITREQPGLEGCSGEDYLQVSSNEQMTSNGGCLDTLSNADSLVMGSPDSLHSESVGDTEDDTVAGSMDRVDVGTSEKTEEAVGENSQLAEANAGVEEDVLHVSSVEKHEPDAVLLEEYFTQPGSVKFESNADGLSGERDNSEPSKEEEAVLSVEEKGGDAVPSVKMLLKGSGSVVDENEKLRELVEKLITAGQEQLKTISDLSGRVRDLERQLSKKRKKVKVRRPRHGGSSTLCSSDK
ncbi:hypothetical protein H6P81_014482 [Aristolochia fimbriata]|uniref:BAG domain-containing protein n=1 Tax=Aristolochia fimbriata TaxID=158543 RepID=A0AAV7EIB6_ARIFI|nr:hypothetical protein H6P81_014482 [Aristolochia fimbriata]